MEERKFNIHNIIDHKEAIDIIKHYEANVKTGNKKTPIRYDAAQGQMLKKFKDMEGFIENVGLSRSTVYFRKALSSKKLLCIITLF